MTLNTYLMVLTLCACLTKFSITPSKASFSFRNPSRLLSQYSSTWLVFSVKLSNSFTCACNSSSVNPAIFSGVVAQSLFTCCKSRLGGGGGPGFIDAGRGRPRGLGVPVGVEADASLVIDVVLSLTADERSLESGSLGWGESSPVMLVREGFVISGSMSFFCFEGGRISSRSTGTPRLMRKRRRIRDWVQFGGCKGGGVMSCFHSE